MTLKTIVPGVHVLSLKIVNVFLIEHEGELTLIDTGVAGSDKAILQAVSDLGYEPHAVRHILITHLHMDHVGGLAAIKATTGGTVYMHGADAAALSQGVGARPMYPGPGIINAILGRVMSFATRGNQKIDPIGTDVIVTDGEILPIAGGMRVVHTPGHTQGHTAFLWEPGKVLFGGDALSKMFGLDFSPIYEDIAEGRKSIRKLAGIPFDTLCLSHGAALVGDAARNLQRFN